MRLNRIRLGKHGTTESGERGKRKQLNRLPKFLVHYLTQLPALQGDMIARIIAIMEETERLGD